ncbi:MAG: TetR/AcrR family transcriptional regulator [Pseudonocardia sp.]|nr:TetR/AcrR family transcriptional regulator [Pseudonocardia sp.]
MADPPFFSAPPTAKGDDLPDDLPADARARAGRTKRGRTRRALLSAARVAFASTGWSGTRLEDIARQAGVSVASTYNHFPTKHGLVANVFAPVLAPRLDRPKELLDAGHPVPEVLERHVRDLAELIRAESPLTVAFTSAVAEYTAKIGGPPDPSDHDDPRVIAPVAAMVIELVARGQANGDFRPYPPAHDIAGQAVNLLLLRGFTRTETPAAGAEVILTMLFGTLKPETLLDTGFTGRPFAASGSDDAPDHTR